MPTRKNKNCLSSSNSNSNNLSHTPTTPIDSIADSNINIKAANPHQHHCSSRNCSLALAWLSVALPVILAVVFTSSISTALTASEALTTTTTTTTEEEGLFNYLAFLANLFFATSTSSTTATTTELKMSLEKQDAAAAAAAAADDLKHNKMNSIIARLTKQFPFMDQQQKQHTTKHSKMHPPQAAAIDASLPPQTNNKLHQHQHSKLDRNDHHGNTRNNGIDFDIDDDGDDDDDHHLLPSTTTTTTTSSRLPDSYNNRNSLFLFSKSEGIPNYYSVDMSTQENYGVENNDEEEYYGKFRGIRASLDFEYHGNYIRSRQEFQDKIVEKLLDGTTIHDSTNGRVCKTPTEPWIVFTAGVMGAGKSHTMKQLESKGLFPLQSYIVVDPDEIRSHFPEYHLYAKQSPKQAGELTHREAGYVTEIVTAAAMERGYNVLVDGSLKDSEWYHQYFTSLRNKYPNIRIAILHIIAPREAIFERAAHRAKETGRVVPIETLELSLRQVPISVKKLAPVADCFCELDNSPTSGEVSLKTEGMTWDEFRDNWAQTCPWVPPSSVGVTRGKDSTDEGNGDM